MGGVQLLLREVRRGSSEQHHRRTDSDHDCRPRETIKNKIGKGLHTLRLSQLTSEFHPLLTLIAATHDSSFDACGSFSS